MHYVSNDWKLGKLLHHALSHSCRPRLLLEEVLIDFREVVGSHSGANLGEGVWDTIRNYGLEEKVNSNPRVRTELTA